MAKRNMITINEELCTGCGQCVPACAEGALAIVDGKARLVKDVFCDGLGACLGDCPTGALKVEVREAEDFDPEAVRTHLTAQGRAVPDHMPDPASLRVERGGAPTGGCPGAALHTLTPCERANAPQAAAAAGPGAGSALGHWPVQLRLVPPDAPFLRGADLLLTADCVPVALPGYHAQFVPGRVVLLGCPKFDDQAAYVDKLAAVIERNGLASITVLEMEVPCCASMTAILNRAFERAGVRVPTIRVTVARNGAILAMNPV